MIDSNTNIDQGKNVQHERHQAACQSTQSNTVRHFSLAVLAQHARDALRMCFTASSASRLFSILALAIVITLGTGATNSALADGEARTRAQAIDIAKGRSGDGRVLSVKKKVNNNGDSIFAVKIISNGRVKVYSVREFKK